MAGKSRKVEDVLDRLGSLGDEKDKVSVSDVVEALGNRGYGPFIFVPALIEITPVGAVPGVPTLLATIIVFMAAQMLLGRHHIWTPGILGRRRIAGRKLRQAADKLQPVGDRLDRWFPGRLPQLTGALPARLAAIVILILCLSVPPLELVPFASSAPMLTIAIFGLALTLRDGVLMAVGFLLTLVALGIGFGVLGGGG